MQLFFSFLATIQRQTFALRFFIFKLLHLKFIYLKADNMTISLDAYTPAEVVMQIAQSGVDKGNMRLDKVFFSAASAGCLLAFACGTVLSTSTTPWFQENAPGLIRTIGALVFPYGLCMIILTGADLCTGSFLVCDVLLL